ncbi:tRNA (N6-threonylcarbamoyladenosine(37)-N6)-methyltransferase TrmO [Xanthobacter sp. KR7-65]|uniref:tRNA (N6-threonylcarbamoyladenosine(37)-N6)-methyltransferase TrmO n=1 Tax=Xanthobacter sp. KR7-65 TaxID=3156612 RepID=UPI0032B5CCDE
MRDIPPAGPVDDDIRSGEKAVALPQRFDAGLYFIGLIRTPWTERRACPRRGDVETGPVCTLEIDPRWTDALEGVADCAVLQVLYWMNRARRDLVLQSPRDGATRGTFALRSPVRPNPIASSMVRLVAVDGLKVQVRGLDCLDGTPLIDLKSEPR